jgi:hypothetical protein
MIVRKMIATTIFSHPKEAGHFGFLFFTIPAKSAVAPAQVA